MKGSSSEIPGQANFVGPDLMDRPNPRRELVAPADKIPWKFFGKEFSRHCSPEIGRPSRPIRRTTGLLILKQMENPSGGRIVEAWIRDRRMRRFRGETGFHWGYPCDPSELSRFRKRTGVDGAEKILQVSIAVEGKKAFEKEAAVDTAVREKNIRFPSDAEPHRKIMERSRKTAEKYGAALRRSYTRTVEKPAENQRFANHPGNRKKALEARRSPKTIAGRLVR